MVLSEDGSSQAAGSGGVANEHDTRAGKGGDDGGSGGVDYDPLEAMDEMRRELEAAHLEHIEEVPRRPLIYLRRGPPTAPCASNATTPTPPSADKSVVFSQIEKGAEKHAAAVERRCELRVKKEKEVQAAELARLQAEVREREVRLEDYRQSSEREQEALASRVHDKSLDSPSHPTKPHE